MPGPLEGQIWLHVSSRPQEHAVPLAEAAGGVVIEEGSNKPLYYERAKALVSSDLPAMLQHRGRPPSVTSVFGSEEQWLLEQTELEVLSSPTYYLAPSQKVDSRELGRHVAASNRFLRAAARDHPSKPTLAMFAVHHDWLKLAAARADLIAALKQVDGPVGLMLAKSNDPLDHIDRLAGLIEIVQQVPEMYLIRSDLGAVGAFAFGAAGGSIGVGPGTRHFIPLGQQGRAITDDPTPRLLVDRILAFWRGSKLGHLGDMDFFDCYCRVCGGQSLARFQDERLDAEADRHTVTCWLHMVRQLQALPPGRAREDYWVKQCSKAWTDLAWLDDHRAIVERPSPQLEAWVEFAGVRTR